MEQRQGWSLTQHLMAETAAHAQPPATPRGVRSVELADTMGAEGTSVEVESALRAAVSPEPALEAAASPIPMHTLRRGQGSHVVTLQGRAPLQAHMHTRPYGGRLSRRPSRSRLVPNHLSQSNPHI